MEPITKDLQSLSVHNNSSNSGSHSGSGQTVIEYFQKKICWKNQK